MLGQERFHALESASASFAANPNSINNSPINILQFTEAFLDFPGRLFVF